MQYQFYYTHSIDRIIVVLQDDTRNVTFPYYERTKEEMETPFAEGSPVSRAGLRLLSLDIQAHDCPMYKTWLRHSKEGEYDGVDVGQLQGNLKL